jgi:hypothetical protein
MKWKKTSEQRPIADQDDDSKYKQTLCLVLRHNDVEMLAYNHTEHVWDGSDYDDYECDFDAIEYFFEVHLLEFEK